MRVRTFDYKLGHLFSLEVQISYRDFNEADLDFSDRELLADPAVPISEKLRIVSDLAKSLEEKNDARYGSD